MRSPTVQHTSFFILLALVTAAFFGLIRDFLQPVFWAAIFAILFHPLQVKSGGWFRKRRSAAAVLTILVITILVIVPFFLVAVGVTQEGAAMLEHVSKGNGLLGEVSEYLKETIPAISNYVAHSGVDLQKIQEKLSDAAVSASGFLASQMVNVGQLTAGFVINFLLMLYILFFFLRDGDKIVSALIRALPFGDMRERMLFKKFAEVSRATVKGTLVVGVVQGGIGGVAFWILGIEAPVLWGVLMAIFSLLPVGTAIVWGPAAIILMIQGKMLEGIILILVGVLIIGLVDNLLRPLLVGRGARMPDFLVLMATVGGLTTFGISGFVLGPILAALFLAVWDMFAQEYTEPDLKGTELSLPGDGGQPVPPVK